MSAPLSFRRCVSSTSSSFLHRLHLLAVGFAAIPLLSALAAAQAPAYVADDLGLPPHYVGVYPTALNHAGQVAGYLETSDGYFYLPTGFVWSKATGIQLIQSLHARNTDVRPSAIGADGTIVGLGGAQGGIVVRGGQTSTLPTLAGIEPTDGYLWQPTAINQAGTIVGYANYPWALPYGYSDRGFMISGSQIIDLNTLWPDGYLAPLAINDRGEIVGRAGFDGNYLSAPSPFVYGRDGFSQLLPTTGFWPTEADAINNRGQVVGYGSPRIDGQNTAHRHGFLYASGQVADVGAPSGFTDSQLASINDSGEAVGYASGSSGTRAIYFSPATGLLPLPAPSLIRGPDGNPVIGKTVEWINAVAINDVGMIAATGRYSDGSIHGFLLTPLDATPLAIAAPPTAQFVRTGTSATFSVAVSGLGTIHYQWTKDGAPIPGETESNLTIAPALPADAGRYAVTVSNAVSEVTSAAASLQVAQSQLANLSSRVRSAPGDDVAITGFVIAGQGTKKVLLRALGPSLVDYGIARTEALSDPTLELHDRTGIVATNDDWWASADGPGVTATAATLGATAFSTGDDASSALLLDLAPGTYTFLTTGKGGTAGIALNEVYDADPANSAARLVNVSVRARCGTGNAVTIGGFVVSGPVTKRVLIRAVGPALTSLGVSGALADPVLEVHDQGHGNAVIATNDNWADFSGPDGILATSRRLGATPDLNNDAKSAALVLTLPPGVYSFVAYGKGATSGVVLIEAYDAD